MIGPRTSIPPIWLQGLGRVITFLPLLVRYASSLEINEMISHIKYDNKTNKYT